ncbi:MAG: transglycosylase SLT domain-containing protein [Casimicrobiaceae bacterium]|nr:transglycosylase SLT domain-containing protein [Pseudomonadota bacterium]
MLRAKTTGFTCSMVALVGAGIAAIAPLALADAGATQPIDSATSKGVVQQAAMSEQLARALAYEHGEGLPKDQKIAAAVYCDAAVRGSAEAAFQLGWMYANGRGVPHDDGTAAALFELAASDGHRFARTALARVGDVHGLLPDCMRPVEPPPLEPPPEPQIADAVDYGPDPFDDLPPWKQKIADLVAQLAPRYGIEPRLALAVIAVESNFDALATSSKDARGLMQLVPETAARFNVRNPLDMRDNVRGGLAYLRWLLAYYRGEVTLAVAAYNAGEKAVDRYRGVPPYRETRDYVQRVVRLFRSDYHPYDPRVVEPSIITAHLDVKPK